MQFSSRNPNFHVMWIIFHVLLNSDYAVYGVEIRFCYLGGDCVGFTNLVTPVASSDWDDGEFGQNDGTTDGRGHFLTTLHTQSNMAVMVTNSNERLQ